MAGVQDREHEATGLFGVTGSRLEAPCLRKLLLHISRSANMRMLPIYDDS
jgi:hypothetical protein